jgi:hypothetical protein
VVLVGDFGKMIGHRYGLCGQPPPVGWFGWDKLVGNNSVGETCEK